MHSSISGQMISLKADCIVFAMLKSVISLFDTGGVKDPWAIGGLRGKVALNTSFI